LNSETTNTDRARWGAVALDAYVRNVQQVPPITAEEYAQAAGIKGTRRAGRDRPQRGTVRFARRLRDFEEQAEAERVARVREARTARLTG
jgi:hypothetical protein